MADAHVDSRVGTDALRVRMRIWHPECWNIDVSERVDAGILGHGLYGVADGRGYTRLTVYGDTAAEVDAAVERARESEDTYAVHEASHAYWDGRVAAPGNATRELLVERTLSNQISQSLLTRGFVYDEPIDVRDGVENWTVLTGLDRDEIRRALDEICDTEEAVIDVTGITEATRSGGSGGLSLGRLSARQREVFQRARERGYYDWPKATSADELAAELDITTSTFHEHLHKAEAKLLHDPLHRD